MISGSPKRAAISRSTATKNHVSNLIKFLLLWFSAFMSGCMVGPKYSPPITSNHGTYKAVGLTSPAPTGNWSSAFSDPTLKKLLTATESANNNIAAAYARYNQARAILGLKRADRFPAVTGQALMARQQDTGNDIFELPKSPYRRYRSALNLDYEIDFWGRVRHSISKQEALTQASANDYLTALLSTKAELTRDYIALRHLDSEITLLNNTIKLRKENQKLVEARVNAGDTAIIDSLRAESQTETAIADLYRIKQRRNELENAIAALTGANPSLFRIKPSFPPPTPAIPSGVPAELLRRRPDVAATERRLAASAEEIGIAITNYLPRVSLTARGGFASLSSSELFDPTSQLWNIGPSITFPLLNMGSRKNDKNRAKAIYYEALAKHKQSILIAFRDVENALSGIKNLNISLAAQEKSAAAASEAARLINLRYNTGLVSFFEVIAAERDHLIEQRMLVQTKAARQQATVQLIQALGGGWK